MRPEPYLSVVAPCFNEEAGLREFHRRISAACRAVAGDAHEIVLINDGSKDHSWTLMQLLAEEDPHVVAINLSRNFGHQLALTAGLHQCRGEVILIIDADLQDPPELLPSMLTFMRQSGADVVFGQRRKRAGESRSKKATAALFYRLLRRLIDIDIPIDTGDFRLITRRALDILNTMPEQFRFMRGMVSWIGFNQVPFLYDRDPRFAGSSGYPLRKMVAFALDAVTSFSIAPLRMASAFGFAFGIGGLLMLLYTLGSFLFGTAVIGWTSLASIILILGSVQLILLGISGEYLGRLYLEAKGRPLYVVETIEGQGLSLRSPAEKVEEGEITRPTEISKLTRRS